MTNTPRTLPPAVDHATDMVRNASSTHREGSLRCLSVVLGLALLLSACDGSGPPRSPISPAPLPPTSNLPGTPAAPAATYTLSGVVFETTSDGPVPIEGVSVYCDSCGSPEGHTFADTDRDGFYSFAWARGHTPLIVRKDGYQLPSGIPPGPVAGWIVASVTGDTRFDIELVRR